MNDNANKYALLEARLTLLERKMAQLMAESRVSASALEVQPPKDVYFECNTPGLIISKMHPPEWDPVRAMQFCWVGNEGPLQFVLPVKPIKPSICRLTLGPHPAVDMRPMRVIVNDEIVAAESVMTAGILEVTVRIKASAASVISIVLAGVTSIRPSDKGENNDNRLLAARFFGAHVAFEGNLAVAPEV